MRNWIGKWMIGVGVMHTVIGLFLFGGPLHEIVADGVFNTLSPRTPSRYLAFWFLFGGFATMIFGYLADWIERVAHLKLPRGFGWSLLAVALVGVSVTPVSGFWLVFPAAFGAIAQSRK